MLPNKDSKKSFLFRWKYRARGEQRPPRDKDWIVWLLLAGRGFGKTRTGAETVLAEVKARRARRIALVAPTAADAREVMVEGESGILAVATPEYRPIYESSRGRLVWKNGAIASCYSADEPQRLRGPQHDFAWLRIRLKPRQRGEDGAADAANGGIGDREDGAEDGVTPPDIRSSSHDRKPPSRRWPFERGTAMAFIKRTFRLTNEPGGMGLSCTVAGLSLAGVPLLRKTKAGFAPRPAHEILALAEVAYQSPADVARLPVSLDVISTALNRGDVAHAMITAVLTRPPELTWSEAASLAKAEEKLTKYDREESRDWHGRWTDGEIDSPDVITVDRPALDITQTSSTPVQVDPDDTAPDASDDNETELEKKYDYLNPVDFSKKVIEFGWRLETEGKNFTPAEHETALAEYRFLQYRLSFWLSYEYMPLEAQGNLRSAAFSLYEGAVLGGVVPVGGKGGDLPASMLAAVTDPLLIEGSSPIFSSRGLSGRAVDWDEFATAAAEEATEAGPRAVSAPNAPPEPTGEIGGVIDNEEAKIRWGGGDIKKDQGEPWERIYSDKNPDALELADNSKVFDHFYQDTGEAINNKTLNTFCFSYASKPQNVYNRLKSYIDKTADYRPRTAADVSLDDINSRTIHLAIPENTSPAQWQQLERAKQYGRSRGVSVIVTRIRG